MAVWMKNCHFKGKLAFHATLPPLDLSRNRDVAPRNMSVESGRCMGS